MRTRALITKFILINTYSVKTSVLSHFERKNVFHVAWVKIIKGVMNFHAKISHASNVPLIVKLLYKSYEPQASGSVKFDNDRDVIFMFKMY